MILFTADTDWASEEVLNFFFDEISKHSAKWIIFATNKNDRFDELELNGHHIGIHPNFINCNSRQEMEKEVFKMKEIFPNTIFSRSHSLMSGGPIWDSLQKNGIVYDFSNFQPAKHFPVNRRLWNGLIQIGFNWEDDYHFHIKDMDQNIKRQLSEHNNLIVNFHPIHFYLNTTTKQDYLYYLENRNDFKKIETFRKQNWKNNFGCGRLLCHLLHERSDSLKTEIPEFISRLDFENYMW